MTSIDNIDESTGIEYKSLGYAVLCFGSIIFISGFLVGHYVGFESGYEETVVESRAVNDTNEQLQGQIDYLKRQNEELRRQRNISIKQANELQEYAKLLHDENKALRSKTGGMVVNDSLRQSINSKEEQIAMITEVNRTNESEYYNKAYCEWKNISC